MSETTGFKLNHKPALIDHPGMSNQGGGEPAIICMGAVVLNAINDAIGVRLLELPMPPDRVKKAR